MTSRKPETIKPETESITATPSALPAVRQPLRLCFLLLHSYPLFQPACKSAFGGAEVRLSFIAKELAKLPHFDVRVIVFDHDQPARQVIDGVTVIAWRGLRSPLPQTLNAVTQTPRWQRAIQWRVEWLQWYVRKRLDDRRRRHTALGQLHNYYVTQREIAIYDETDADIYLTAGIGRIQAELAFYCKLRSKPFVMSAASDDDFNPAFQIAPEKQNVYGVAGYLANYQIEAASNIIVQSEQQAQQLREHFGRTGIIIRNPISLTAHFTPEAEKKYLLWIGKSNQVKRPELLLQLARTLPNEQFVMVMTLEDQALHLQCQQEAKQLGNVRIIDYVPFAEIELYYAAAKLLINTSLFEGMPNAFLQAAKYRVPIVAYAVDPSGMLSVHGCGIHAAGHFTKFRAAVQELLNDQATYQRLRAQCWQYVSTFHQQDPILAAYRTCLLDLAAAGRN